MAMKLVVTDVRKLEGDGLWEAAMEPGEVRVLGPGSGSRAGPSVLLLTGEPTLRPDGQMEVAPLGVEVLNVGNVTRAILISGGTESDDVPALPALAEAQLLAILRTQEERGHALLPLPAGSSTFSRGDLDFVNATPPHLRSLAERLLRAVRREFAGSLAFKAGSGRFVETPDNWWTVKPQPVARSFRFTVRARLAELEDLQLPKLTKDRTDSYSAFVMERDDQLNVVLAGLRRAAQNRKD